MSDNYYKALTTKAESEGLRISDYCRQVVIRSLKSGYSCDSCNMVIEENEKNEGPLAFIPYLQDIADKPQEHFVVISVTVKMSIIMKRIITIGLLDRTNVHAREVFSDPIRERAYGIILAHNHPSGKVEPSSGDEITTKSLIESGDLLGIKVIDHIIVSGKNYYSFYEKHKLFGK